MSSQCRPLQVFPPHQAVSPKEILDHLNKKPLSGVRQVSRLDIGNRIKSARENSGPVSPVSMGRRRRTGQTRAPSVATSASPSPGRSVGESIPVSKKRGWEEGLSFLCAFAARKREGAEDLRCRSILENDSGTPFTNRLPVMQPPAKEFFLQSSGDETEGSSRTGTPEEQEQAPRFRQKHTSCHTSG